jgi:spoIIIJ-associated protein
MVRCVTKVGKSVDEAIESALLELQLSSDDIEIEIIEEGNKGFFGIGSKEAKVKVTEKNVEINRAKDFLSKIFNNMELDVNIECEKEANLLKISLSGDKMGILIGRRGETLDSLQYLTSLAVNKGEGNYVKVSIDTENYRKKREDTLIRLAKKLADRVLMYRRSITLEPMNPYERRIIHSTLQDNKLISTYSVGDEPNRKVVISLNKKKSYYN